MTKSVTISYDMSKVTNAHDTQADSRKCLMCGERFLSEGRHNRICQKCKSSQTYRSGQTPFDP